MPTLLHIDSSPRGDHSISRKLSAAFAEEWKQSHRDGKVIHRDLVQTHLTFVDLPWIMAAFSPEESRTPEHKAALKLSDELIHELLSADHIVIGAPMYNFSIPAALKAWIDHIVRVGVTFNVTPGGGYQGLVTGRKATVIIASGGDYQVGGPAEGYNMEAPYLKAILGFIGITDVKVVLAGGTTGIAQGKVDEKQYLAPLEEETKKLAVA